MLTRPENAPGAQLDLTGLKCPLPVLKIRRALLDLPRGCIMEAVVTDPMAEIDVPDLVKELGFRLLAQEKSGAALLFRIEKS